MEYQTQPDEHNAARPDEKSTLQKQWEDENKKNSAEKKPPSESHPVAPAPPAVKPLDAASFSTATKDPAPPAQHKDLPKPQEPKDESNSNKRKSNNTLEPLDKSKNMYNKANNSKETTISEIGAVKTHKDRIKSVSSTMSSDSKTITRRKLW